jgi:hypothetical protein
MPTSLCMIWMVRNFIVLLSSLLVWSKLIKYLHSP